MSRREWLRLAVVLLISGCGARTNLDPSFVGEARADVRVPRPVAPLSLGDVSLLRPTLRWELPAPFDGVVLELCRDRGCTNVLETLSVEGTSARPSNPLPAQSVVFWRIRGTTRGVINETYSATWLFHVPLRDNSRGIDTSSNAHVDVNGDGYDDVVVGAHTASPGGQPSAGSASVFHGGPDGIAAQPNIIVVGGAESGYFGAAVSGAGDVDGDGFGDLVVGAFLSYPQGRVEAGAANLFHGSPMGVQRTPTKVLPGLEQQARFGQSVAAAGDLNGDGYGDVVVGAPAHTSIRQANSGSATVFWGSAQGISVTASQVLEGRAGERFGNAVASAGDVNGDGVSDLVVAAFYASPGGRNRAGAVYVYHGTRGGNVTQSRVVEGVRAGDNLGHSASSAGDVNGDGFDDLLVGASLARRESGMVVGTASLYLGSETGILQNPATLIEGAGDEELFGSSVAGLGDVNGDGLSDFVVGAPYADARGRESSGTASVFLGHTTMVATTPARVLEGNAELSFFGICVAGAGDANGDGLSDVIVGSVGLSQLRDSSAGTASIYYGGRLGISSTPGIVLQSDASTDAFGQAVAFRQLLSHPTQSHLRRDRVGRRSQS